jgi:hypothetical protein
MQKRRRPRAHRDRIENRKRKMSWHLDTVWLKSRPLSPFFRGSREGKCDFWERRVMRKWCALTCELLSFAVGRPWVCVRCVCALVSCVSPGHIIVCVCVCVCVISVAWRVQSSVVESRSQGGMHASARHRLLYYHSYHLVSFHIP